MRWEIKQHFHYVYMIDLSGHFNSVVMNGFRIGERVLRVTSSHTGSHTTHATQKATKTRLPWNYEIN